MAGSFLDGDWVVVVLAGGEGRRIGGGKPLRLWRGRSLLVRSLELARGYGRDVAVAVRSADQAGEGVDAGLLLDPPSVPGPLAGLASALQFARDCGVSLVQTLACDMPELPDDLTRRLATALEPGLCAVLPASNGRLHPVCGLWSVEIEPLLAEYLARGRSSLRGLAEAAGVKVVDWGQVDPDPFININTAADLEACGSARSETVRSVSAAKRPSARAAQSTL
jgi:molybdopterin-guanine dinucleotide biosynthesis protein A